MFGQFCNAFSILEILGANGWVSLAVAIFISKIALVWADAVKIGDFQTSFDFQNGIGQAEFIVGLLQVHKTWPHIPEDQGSYCRFRAL